jgi:hypothetical protein
MAALATPHWEAVTAGSQELLITLGQLELLCPFYLAGGTALALRLGHRISVDLDLFAEIDNLDDALRRGIVDALRERYAIDLLQDSVLRLVLLADGQPASFFSYGYPLLDSTEAVSGVHVAGLRDIGLMKLDAVVGRGTRKDFYDLYCMAPHVSLDELFARSDQKYPHSPGFAMRVLTALVDFDIADQEEDPILLWQVDWEQVKAFFVSEARRLGQEWFGGRGSA